MILDKQHQMSSEQAVTVTDVASTNVVDQVVAGQALRELYAEVRVHTAFAGGTSILFSLQDSADNSTFADLVAGAAIPTASLTKGAVVFQARIPQTARRYLRMWYNVTDPMTAGKLNAYLTREPLQRDVGGI